MSKMVTVFQVKDEHTREYGFRRLDRVWGEDAVDMSVYEAVFGEREIAGWALFDFPKSDMEALEAFFRLTNIPSEAEAKILKEIGWKGRSMSVSDIVKVNDTFYYCDSFGWQKIAVHNVPNWIYPGMGATGCYYSDLYAYEVTRLSPSGKTVYIRRMEAKLISGNTMDGSAEYAYTSDPAFSEEAVRKTKKGWRTSGGMHVGFGSAREYRDPSF